MSFKKILEKLKTGNTLYYPGCLTKTVLPKIQENYEKSLRKAGINFIMLASEELCCGSPALKGGYKRDFEKLAQKNLLTFKKFSVTKIITNCPACFRVFSKDYPAVLGKKWNIKVEHITQTIDKSNLFKKSKHRPNYKEKITYHDPCHLGKQMGVYQQPRKIIKAAGFKIQEMKFCRQGSFCCGGGGGLQSNNPRLAKKICQKRLEQAEEVGTKTLVTPCPLCFLHFKQNSKRIKIKELSELL